jgi:hypothetical protein
MKKIILNHQEVLNFLNFLLAQKFLPEYLKSKHKLHFLNNTDEKIFQLRLPVSHSYIPLKRDLEKEEMKNYVLIMIRAGVAAVGYFENYENVDHKVFRAYMVRQKQGKSQVKYLKTKGKSRAGSRIRLAETVEFFNEINSRLTRYFNEYRIDSIGLSCAGTLMPYFYNAKVAPPFDKDDERLFKIPRHIQNPTYESLLETNNFLLKTELLISEDGVSVWERFKQSDKTPQDFNAEDDW